MKHSRKILAVCTAAAALICLSGCGKIMRNPYEVAKELGYEGTQGDWLAETVGSGTKEHQWFEEAKAEGYEGTFVDFLKDIGKDRASSGAGGILSSMVSVVSRSKKTPSIFSNDSSGSSIGAGVIYSLEKEEGSAYLLTNYHVVYSESAGAVSSSISVYLYGGEISGGEIPAEYVGGSMAQDIAVLKIENSPILSGSAATAALKGDSDALMVGEEVFAVGNPNAQGLSVTKGVVSVDAEYIEIETADGKGSTDLLEIRTDAAINHGNSGGGLFNSSGELIGVVNARSEASGVDGFGYAIPSNLAYAVAQNIIDNSRTNNSRGALRATLGVTVQVSDSKSVYQEELNRTYISETVTVQSVNLGSIALGKLAAGDVICSIRINENKPLEISRMHMLTNALFWVRKGDTVELVVSRDSKTVTVVLEFFNNGDFTLVN